MEQKNERQPNSQIAENAILAAILWKNELLNNVENMLEIKDFYNKKNQLIYEAMLRLHNNKQAINEVLLSDELSGKIDSGYLIDIQSSMPDIAVVDQYIKIIKDKSKLRDLIGLMIENISYCQNIGNKNIDNLFDEIEKNFNEFSIKRKTSKDNIRSIKELINSTIRQLSNVKSKDGLTGVPSGFISLDQITNGFQKTDLIILAARPSMGKTSMAINIAMNACKKEFKVGVLSLEMSSYQLCLRILSTESNIEQNQLKKNNTQNWLHITDAAGNINNLELWMDDTGTLNIYNIRTLARRLKFEHQIDLLVIDYLQLISSLKRNESRTNEISEITRSLKSLAKELDIPIICLSQLSRKCEDRMDRRPLLSDLRDSGAIEQDADIVIFIYRDHVYNGDADPEAAELIIAKNRNGSLENIRLSFDGKITKFYE